MSDEERGNLLGSEEEEDEEAKKKVSPKRRSFGLRVALQFPTRKSSEKKVPEQAFSNLPLKDSEPLTPLSKEISCKRWDKLEGSASDSEEDIKETEAESSSALLKRAMNIKENKAMVRLRSSALFFDIYMRVLSVSTLEFWGPRWCCAGTLGKSYGGLCLNFSTWENPRGPSARRCLPLK